MPIYEYKAAQAGGCSHCAKGFEKLHKQEEPPLRECPLCGSPVRRIVSAPSLAKPSPSLAPENLERHGFTQYRKSGKGTYEKTAGSGPETITKD